MKTRVAPLTPIMLKLKEEGECLSFEYYNHADMKSEEITYQVLRKLGESCFRSEEVKEALL